MKRISPYDQLGPSSVVTASCKSKSKELIVIIIHGSPKAIARLFAQFLDMIDLFRPGMYETL